MNHEVLRCVAYSPTCGRHDYAVPRVYVRYIPSHLLILNPQIHLIGHRLISQSFRAYSGSACVQYLHTWQAISAATRDHGHPLDSISGSPAAPPIGTNSDAGVNFRRTATTVALIWAADYLGDYSLVRKTLAGNNPAANCLTPLTAAKNIASRCNRDKHASQPYTSSYRPGVWKARSERSCLR